MTDSTHLLAQKLFNRFLLAAFLIGVVVTIVGNAWLEIYGPQPVAFAVRTIGMVAMLATMGMFLLYRAASRVPVSIRTPWNALYPDTLVMNKPDVGDQDVAKIARMYRRLKILSLEGSSITDDALAYLHELPRLEHLNLRRTAVTDVGLDQLDSMSKLKRLALEETNVTERGVALLQTMLPNCEILSGEIETVEAEIAPDQSPARPKEEPRAFLNGVWMPESHAVISVNDMGFLLGATVTERLRTFRGRLFRLDAHLQRLQHSLAIAGIRLPMPLNDLAAAADELARRNHALLDPGDDLNLSLFVTPGLAGQANRPTLGMHTLPLPFYQWADDYERGVPLVVTKVRHLPPDVLPPELKCRSRMHYYLADREAAARDPAARALMLDRDGHVAETSTANVLMYRSDTGILAPRLDKVLPGTSINVLEELAGKLAINWTYRDIALDEFCQADEIMLTSTSPCILPVTTVDGRPIGMREPGIIFRKLLAAWSELVGFDIAAQAKRFAKR